MGFRRFSKNNKFSVVFPPRWAHPLFSEQSASTKSELMPRAWMQIATYKASWSNRKKFSNVFQPIPGNASKLMGADLRKVITSAQQPSCLFQTSTTCMSPASNHPTNHYRLLQANSTATLYSKIPRAQGSGNHFGGISTENPTHHISNQLIFCLISPISRMKLHKTIESPPPPLISFFNHLSLHDIIIL